MTRLIDADALDSAMYHKSFEVDDGRNVWNSGLWIRYKIYEEASREAPTIEAVPVRHGKWDKGTDSYWHICEECGAEVDISMGTGVWVEGVELYELNYCPNCGAKMDAEREEE